MKKYKFSVLLLSIVISFPSIFLISIGLYNEKAITFLFGLFILLLSWGIYFILKKDKKHSFEISFLFINIFWWLLLIQEIKRILFIIENEDMELKNGQGSPLAFLLGMFGELIFFIPLTIAIVAGIKYLSTKYNKT